MAGPLNVAAQRKPVQRGRRRGMWGKYPGNAASQRGLEAARAALAGEGAALEGDAALAEKARYFAEDEARRGAQACLPLGAIE